MRCFAIALACLASAPTVSAQVMFRENFSNAPNDGCVPPAGGAGTYPFPAGWLLRNVDGRTPNAAVSYVNEAWEVREDFASDPNNCAAFSTSWYSPEGRADDWMWTPRIDLLPGSVLQWRARIYDPLYPDGYEVRVMPAQLLPPTGGTGDLGNQVSASTVVFSVDAEQTDWTSRQVRLDAFGTQGVYIGFRNNTDNRFLLLVDDIEVRVVAPDLRVVQPVQPGPWTRLPGGLAVPYALGARANNAGELPVEAGSIPTATILVNGSPFGDPYPTTPLGAVAPLASFDLVWNPSPPPTFPDGIVTTRYSLPVPPNDANPSNNSIETTPVVVGGNELARYLGEPSRRVGIGAGTGGEIGTALDVPAALTVAGVRVRMQPMGPPLPPETDQWTGRPVVATLRVTDASGRPVGQPIATTLAGVGTRDGATYDLPLPAPLTLQPGRYFVAAVEPVDAEAMPLAMHRELFVAGTNWVNWPTNPAGGWATLESFGTAFQETPQIGLLTDLTLFGDGLEDDAPVAHRAQPSANPEPSATRRGSIQRNLVEFLSDGGVR